MPLIAENTEVAVANEALSACKAGRLLSIDADDTEKAKIVRKHFAPTRDALQRSYQWNFNEDFKVLPASAAPPPEGFGFSKRFPWTPDMLGVRTVKGCGRRDWKVQGRSVLANVPGPLKVVASIRQPSVAVWDALFREVMVAALAYAIAPEVATDDETIERARKAAESALQRATPVDAGEGEADQPDDFDVIAGRW
jgi:hypothetical protein